MNIERLRCECKISLPLYKIACSACFVVLLSLVRGISHMEEIGIALNTAMPLLAVVFCADCYQSEYSGRRWEVFQLYSVESRASAVRIRLVVQCLYLCLMILPGYACFFWQQPSGWIGVSQILLFIWTVAATAVSIFFFGTLAMTIANIGRNSWIGMGVALVAWMGCNSVGGNTLLKNYNVFAFSFRDILAPGDYGWFAGTGIAAVLSLVLLAALPGLIRKRG